MAQSHPIEQEIGIETYFTKTSGIGGKLRTKVEDFIVEEISINGKIIPLLHETALNITDLPPSYTYTLVLEKYNLETFHAIKYLATTLNISYKNIGFAGLKDKRAITSQMISFSGVNLQELQKLQHNNIHLNRIKPGKPISLGFLNGNHFQITIRQMKWSYDELQTRLEPIAQNLHSDLPNYYGPQRFGAIRPISHEIGQVLLENDFESAVKIYLTAAFPYENQEIIDIRNSISESWPRVEAEFPKSHFYENHLINYLKKLGLNYKKVFRSVFPKRYLMLFIHALQSYLFNKLLSYRVQQKIPLNQALIGDYVAILDQHSLPTHALYEVNTRNIQFLNNAIKKRKAAIMLPLFGYDLNYSCHPLADQIFRLITENQINLVCFKSCINESLPIKTTFRPVSFRVSDFSISIDELRDQETDDLTDNLNVKTGFSLPKGSYGTIFLRELMKTSPLNY